METGQSVTTDKLRDENQPSLWHNRDFLLLWSGQLVSLFGTQIIELALPLLVLALTDSPALAGLVVALEALPYLVLSLPAGALIDRLNRKAVMIWCDVARTAAFGSVPLAYVLGGLGLAQLCVVALVSGITKVLFDVAALASLPQVVSPAMMSRATSVNMVGEFLARLLGPTMGGLIIGLGKTTVVGAMAAYILNTISFLVSVISLGFIRGPFQTRGNEPKVTNLTGDIVEGLRFLWSQPPLRWMLFITTCLNFLLSPVVLVVIVLMKDYLKVDSLGIGLALSMGGIGGLLGSVVAPWIMAQLHPMRTFFFMMVCWLGSVTLLAVANAIWWVMAGLFMSSLVDAVFSINVISYRSALTPDRLQGRVISSFRVLTFGIIPLGMAAGGGLLALFGPGVVLWGMVVGMAFCTVAASWPAFHKAKTELIE